MAQPYATRQLIKDNLNVLDTSIDADIDKFIDVGDEWVDLNLRGTVTVPITTPDDTIKTISSLYAAGRYEMSLPGWDRTQRSAFIIEAEKQMALYKKGLEESETAPQRKPVLGKTAGNITTE